MRGGRRLAVAGHAGLGQDVHGKFVLAIADVGSGKSATVSAACSSCQRAPAGWITERPALCNNALTKCFLTALANFHTITMRQAKARSLARPGLLQAECGAVSRYASPPECTLAGLIPQRATMASPLAAGAVTPSGRCLGVSRESAGRRSPCLAAA